MRGLADRAKRPLARRMARPTGHGLARSPFERTAFRVSSGIGCPHRKTGPIPRPKIVTLTFRLHSISNRFWGEISTSKRPRDAIVRGRSSSPLECTGFRVASGWKYPQRSQRFLPDSLILTDETHSISSGVGPRISTPNTSARSIALPMIQSSCRNAGSLAARASRRSEIIAFTHTHPSESQRFD